MSDTEIVAGLACSIALVLFGLVGVTLTWNHSESTLLQRKLFLVAFLLRFGLSLLLYVGGLSQTIVGSGDDSGWAGGVGIRDAWEAAGVGPFEWPVAMLEAYQGHHRGYAYLLAIYFSVVRITSQLAAAALDCFCGALTAVLAYRTARLICSERVANDVGWWTACFPLMIIWSSQSIKEPVVILLEGVALYGCLGLKMNGFSIRHFWLIVVALAVLPTFRFYAGYVTGAVVLLTLAMPRLGSQRFSIGSAILVAALVVPLLSSSGALERHTETFEEWGDIERITSFRGAIAAGSGSGVVTTQDMRTSSGLGLATIDGALHLLLAPFPWELRLGSVRMLLTLPEMVVWWLLVFYGLIPGVSFEIRHRLATIMPILLFVCGLGLIYSLTFGNVGVIYRQRAQLMPYLFLFAASGLEQRRLRKSSPNTLRTVNPPLLDDAVLFDPLGRPVGPIPRPERISTKACLKPPGEPDRPPQP